MKNDRTFVSFLRDIFQPHDAQQRYNYYLCDVSDQRVCGYEIVSRTEGKYERDIVEWSNKLCRDTVRFCLLFYRVHRGQLCNSTIRFSLEEIAKKMEEMTDRNL